MNTASSVDRSSILRYAWLLARTAAAAAGEGVRCHIGAAMRRAWAEAKAAAVAAVIPQPVQQQQANAAPAPVWSVVQDFHANAVINHTVVDGMPVLIHRGGRYPVLVDASGRTTTDAMHVSVWVGGTHDSRTGSRVPGSKVNVHVHAHDGFNIRREVYEVVSLDQDEAIAQAMSRIGEATAAARTLRAEKAAWEAGVAPVRALPSMLSRSEYEALCAQYGVAPMSDAVAKDRQADVLWSRQTVAEAIGEFLVGRRSIAIRREEDQRRRDAELAWVAAEEALVEELRQQPVSRTVTMVVVGPTPDEHLRRKELWTVVNRGRDVEIDDDAPSIYGEHLLGHEGCTGREVTFEVRKLPAMVPQPVQQPQARDVRTASTVCEACGRALTDPVSIEAGVGPICRAAGHQRRQLGLFDNPSDYRIELAGDVICVTDLDRGGRTVTNDAAGVIEDLRRLGYDLSRMPVIYRDTQGNWDELVVLNDRFAGFRAIDPDRQQALRALAKGDVPPPDEVSAPVEAAAPSAGFEFNGTRFQKGGECYFAMIDFEDAHRDSRGPAFAVELATGKQHSLNEMAAFYFSEGSL